MAFNAEALTKKVGPLPVWAYGAIVAGGAWAYRYWTTRNSEGNSGALGSYDYFGVPADDSTGVDYSGDTGVPGSGGGSAPGAGGTNAPTDNQTWFQLASNYLVGFNYDAVAVSNALLKYLQGEALTASERGLVNQAIARYGVPPEGVPISPGNPPVPPPIVVPPDDRPGTPKPPSTDPPKPPKPRQPPSDPGPPKPPTTPPKTPPKPAPAPAYESVPVAKWILGHVVWNATMWGIAKHYGYGSSSTNYLPIWNDSKNAALKAKRKSPSNIREGDIVYVKRK